MPIDPTTTAPPRTRTRPHATERRATAPRAATGVWGTLTALLLLSRGAGAVRDAGPMAALALPSAREPHDAPAWSGRHAPAAVQRRVDAALRGAISFPAEWAELPPPPPPPPATAAPGSAARTAAALEGWDAARLPDMATCLGGLGAAPRDVTWAAPPWPLFGADARLLTAHAEAAAAVRAAGRHDLALAAATATLLATAPERLAARLVDDGTHVVLTVATADDPAGVSLALGREIPFAADGTPLGGDVGAALFPTLRKFACALREHGGAVQLDAVDASLALLTGGPVAEQVARGAHLEVALEVATRGARAPTAVATMRGQAGRGQASPAQRHALMFTTGQPDGFALDVPQAAVDRLPNNATQPGQLRFYDVQRGSFTWVTQSALHSYETRLVTPTVAGDAP